MKIFIYTAAVLIGVTIAEDDRCRFNVPVTSSVLKCGDGIYHRDQKVMDAINFCGIGRNGTKISNQDIYCIFEKIGYIENDKTNFMELQSFLMAFLPSHVACLVGIATTNEKPWIMQKRRKHTTALYV
ncbi:unnamed protein product [Allacma fusca]|uniref:Uncharacterized protein n=1 Tax=Allacma fusca TaxID=39272 RepID=A0A8J2KTK3_9HEXA|nr:unnamed protein product [Allacma fusca]